MDVPTNASYSGFVAGPQSHDMMCMRYMYRLSKLIELPIDNSGVVRPGPGRWRGQNKAGEEKVKGRADCQMADS